MSPPSPPPGSAADWRYPLPDIKSCMNDHIRKLTNWRVVMSGMNEFLRVLVPRGDACIVGVVLIRSACRRKKEPGIALLSRNLGSAKILSLYLHCNRHGFHRPWYLNSVLTCVRVYSSSSYSPKKKDVQLFMPAAST